MSEENNDNNEFGFIEEAQDENPAALDVPQPSTMDDFDFIEHYGEEEVVNHENLLAENTAVSPLNCAVLGIGGGGGKMAKAFLDAGFNRTLLVNTTAKDVPVGVPDENVVLIPDSDGIGKDVALGKAVFDTNSAVVEDALRTRARQC